MQAAPAVIRQASALIRAGGLVAFPTETVYGLGANALDPRAVEKIYQVKGRPPTSPLIVHVDSVDMARTLVTAWPEAAARLAARWWPGPLTLILPKAAAVPDIVTAGLPTVGLRVPDHPVALALIREAGLPLAAPSANPFSRLSPTTAEHVREALGERSCMILDGGPCRVGIESTVISLAGPRPVLLRPGMVPAAEIEQVIGEPLVGWRRDIVPADAHPAPGMHARHYSPRTPLYAARDRDLPAGRGITLRLRDMPAAPEAYAASLYQRLHELDQQAWDWIAIELPPDEPAWAAVRDRLLRAVTG